MRFENLNVAFTVIFELLHYQNARIDPDGIASYDDTLKHGKAPCKYNTLKRKLTTSYLYGTA